MRILRDSLSVVVGMTAVRSPEQFVYRAEGGGTVRAGSYEILKKEGWVA